MKTKMSKKRLFLLLFLFISFCTHLLYGQVTIGSGYEPADGVLLDLKQWDMENGGKTADKGLLFPRVELASPTSLEPLLNATDAQNIAKKLAHKGTVVYNLVTPIINSKLTDQNLTLAATSLNEGLYYWDGEQWNRLNDKDGTSIESWLLGGNDATDETALIGTTNRVGLKFIVNDMERMRLNTLGYLGIGTVSPKQTLHVDGTAQFDGEQGVYITGLPTTTSNVGTVVVAGDGKLSVMGSANSKPISYINYTVEKVAGDWIYNLNTNIPTDEYTLIIVSAQFSIPKPATTYGYIKQNSVVIATPQDLINRGATPVTRVYATPITANGIETWHLYADYEEASTMSADILGTWTFDCLIISNALVKKLAPKTINLNGTTGRGEPGIPIPDDL